MDMNCTTAKMTKFNTSYGEQPFFQKRIQTHQRCNAYSNTISEFYKLNISDQHPPVIVIPDGCMDIIFECNQTQPKALICGLLLDTQVVPLKADTPYFGIRFLPGVIPSFIDASGEEILNKVIDFKELICDKNDLIENIASLKLIEDQIHLFLTTFEKQLTRNFSKMTEYIIHSIIHQNNHIKIKDLEESTGYSYRHIQRIFKQDVGISIKAFSCIIRFQSAIHALNESKIPKLSDLTYDLGYNDQAHFYKEFKKFSHMSPTDFIKHLKNYNL